MNISESALIRRINRRLAREGQRLRTLRGNRWESTLGRHYIVDLVRDPVVAASHCDLEQVARELNALKPGETLADDAETAQ